MVERLETMTDNGMSLDDEVDDNQLQFDFAGDSDEPADPSNLMDEVEQFLREQNGNQLSRKFDDLVIFHSSA